VTSVCFDSYKIDYSPRISMILSWAIYRVYHRTFSRICYKW
jgi:hypothetical protein